MCLGNWFVTVFRQPQGNTVARLRTEVAPAGTARSYQHAVVVLPAYTEIHTQHRRELVVVRSVAGPARSVEPNSWTCSCSDRMSAMMPRVWRLRRVVKRRR